MEKRIKDMEQVFQKEPLGFWMHLFMLVRGSLRQNRKPFMIFLRWMKSVWPLNRVGAPLFYRKFGGKTRTCMWLLSRSANKDWLVLKMLYFSELGNRVQISQRLFRVTLYEYHDESSVWNRDGRYSQIPHLLKEKIKVVTWFWSWMYTGTKAFQECTGTESRWVL